MITSEQIDKIVAKYQGRPGFRATPVENFLGSMGGETRSTCLLNLHADALAYKWKSSIVTAIREGIKVAFGQ